MTIPPLKITNGSDVAVMNKWADKVGVELDRVNSELKKKAHAITTVQQQVADSTAVPPMPTSVFGTNGGKVVDNVLLDTVTTQYTAPNPLNGFAGVFLVAKNYNGSSALVKVNEDTYSGVGGGTHSFVTTLQRTGESVTFYAVPKNSLEVTPTDWSTAPSFVLTLDGNISAPPAPTFSQTLVATPTGYQFGFTQVVAAAQVIDSYKVYRNTSNTTLGATVIRVVKHDQTNAGSPIVVQDQALDGVPYFYWVSSVNTSGLESTLAAAQSGTIFATVPMALKGTPVVSSPLIPTNSVVTGGGLGQWVLGNTATLPGSIEWDVYSTGGLLDVLLYSSTGASGPNGYLLRFDARTGHVAGQILKITNGTWSNIGTQIAANNAVALSGWHNVVARVTGQGQFDIFVDGIWQTTAVDTTYSLTGAMYYGYEVTSGSMISATGFNVDPSSKSFITKGSTPVSANTITLNGMTWSTTSTSVTFSWVQTPIFRADGTIYGFVAGGTQAVTGLLASNAYTAYPYWDEVTQTMKWVSSELVFPTMTSVGLNGTSQYITTTTSVNSLPTQFCLEAWVKTTAASGQQVIMSLFSPQTGTGAPTHMDMVWTVGPAGEINFQYVNSVGSVVNATTSSASVNDGAWHHIVVGFATGGTITIYVDGVSKGTSSALGAPRNLGFALWYRIGFAPANASFLTTSNSFFNGSLSEITLYNAVPLSATQISNHVVTGINVGFPVTNGYDATILAETSPAALWYWKLNDTSGTTAVETISGTNAGTYQGTPTLNQQASVVVPTGSPAYLWPYKNFLCTQAQSLQNRIPLSDGSLGPSTPSSGSGSGGGGGVGGGGQGGCWSGNTLVKTPNGPVRIDQWIDGTLVLTAAGTWKPASLKKHESRRWKMIDPMSNGEFVTVQHSLLTEAGWKRAHVAFPDHAVIVLEDQVYDLKVDAPESESELSLTTEHSYTLESGLVAHNTSRMLSK
jgi:hypothetical protein